MTFEDFIVISEPYKKCSIINNLWMLIFLLIDSYKMVKNEQFFYVWDIWWLLIFFLIIYKKY
jgi:hypothetical protein